MRKFLTITAVMMITLFSVGLAHAENADAIKASLVAMREAALAMVGAPDAASLEKALPAVASTSAAVDAALAKDGGAGDKWAMIKTVWGEYKSVRDAQVIPALKAGKKDEAVAIAKGPQADRYKSILATLAELGAK